MLRPSSRLSGQEIVRRRTRDRRNAMIRAMPLVCLLHTLVNPSAAAQEVAEVPGSLLLIGGRHQDLRKDIRDAFFELAGGKKARIVVIPTAVAEDDPDKLDKLLNPWRELQPL